VSALLALPEAGGSAQGLIAGAAGDIECQISMPRGAPRGVAVACHPHPLFGGAMSNKVVYQLASCAAKFGLIALRFNFRGVGRSAGVHDAARGETDDCVTAVEWLRAQAPGLPLLLSGFSFGAFVSLNAAARVGPAALVSIAPPFGRYFDDAPNPPSPGCPWLALHSRDDDTVAYAETAAILAQYQPPPTLVTLDGAGHFFHGRLQDIQDAMLPFLERHWPSA
jgi:uncharacterized protein